jgi:RNA-binding protein
MAEIELTPRQRQELKGAAHRLEPVVLLGAGGLSEAVVKEIDRALTAHELIKVRVPGDDRIARDDIFRDVAERLGAARVQMIGKLFVLFRPNPDKTEESAANVRSTKAPAPRSPKKSAGSSVRTKADKRDIRTTAPRPAPRRDAKAVEHGSTRRPAARRGGARSR